jgi:hypothetical protein
MSVRPSARNNLSPGERIFMIFDTSEFFENLSRTVKFHCNMTTITGTVHEDQNTFLYHISLISS